MGVCSYHCRGCLLWVCVHIIVEAACCGCVFISASLYLLLLSIIILFLALKIMFFFQTPGGEY